MIDVAPLSLGRALVVMFDDDEPSSLLNRFRPDVCVKGADYLDRVNELPETRVVQGHGGRMEFAPLIEGVSSSGRLELLSRSTQLRSGPRS